MSLTNTETVEAGLNHFCDRHSLTPVSELRLLTGGANMELWAFQSDGAPLVLRRYRFGRPPEGAEEHLSMANEAQIVSSAFEAGIKAPEVIGVLEDGDELGPGYVMRRIDGESLPQKLFRDESYAAALKNLTKELADELAKIHKLAIPADLLETRTPKDLLQGIEEIFALANYKSPVVAAALHWLYENMPDTSASTCFLHGDFRMGNVLVSKEGLSAVLDWELVHFGAPEQDLSWLCMPSWRFGNYEKTAGGVGFLSELVDAYRAAGGQPIDEATLNWYLVYSSLSWGSMTIRMAHFWRSGQDPSLERILIGTRVSEVEMDLLLMLEEINGISHTEELTITPDDAPEPGGDVRAEELTKAAVHYLTHQVVAESQGAAKFHARIAANALSIAQRIMEIGPEFQARADKRRADLGLTDDALISGLRNGNLDWRNPALLSHLRHTCLERLTLHQPKYAAYKVAMNKWRKP